MGYLTSLVAEPRPSTASDARCLSPQPRARPREVHRHAFNQNNCVNSAGYQRPAFTSGGSGSHVPPSGATRVSQLHRVRSIPPFEETPVLRRRDQPRWFRSVRSARPRRIAHADPLARPSRHQAPLSAAGAPLSGVIDRPARSRIGTRDVVLALPFRARREPLRDAPTRHRQGAQGARQGFPPAGAAALKRALRSRPQLSERRRIRLRGSPRRHRRGDAWSRGFREEILTTP